MVTPRAALVASKVNIKNRYSDSSRYLHWQAAS